MVSTIAYKDRIKKLIGKWLGRLGAVNHSLHLDFFLNGKKSWISSMKKEKICGVLDAHCFVLSSFSITALYFSWISFLSKSQNSWSM